MRMAVLAAVLAALAVPALAQNGPPGPGYEVVSNGAVLELRFHGIPLKSVHADDAQSALSLDFGGPVDPAVFDQLGSALPQWIAMAYANYDDGVIRATRPVTFLTRQETDGFSLRLVPRDGAMAAAGPPDLRGSAMGAPAPYPAASGYPPPGAYPQQPYPPQPYPPQPYPGAPGPGGIPPVPLALNSSFAAARNYYGLQYAVHRGDPVWAGAYDGAALQGDSEFGLGTEYHRYHNGDATIRSALNVSMMLGGGVSILGGFTDNDTKSDQVRASDGTFLSNTHTNDISGSAGLSVYVDGGTRLSLEGLVGNHVGGGRLGLRNVGPDGFFAATLAYHQAYLDTPEAVFSDAYKDEAVLATGQRLGSGLWGDLQGHFTNYGVHGDASATQTAGWDAGLRWDGDMGVGLNAGIAYDGHGDYRLDDITFTGAAPSPYVPLSLRNLETHAVTASLSSLSLGEALWIDLYGGYVYDRYAASGGGLYGAGLRYRPAPGFDLELGARHTTVSLTQGETGPETSVGLNLTFGFSSMADRVF